MGTIAALTKGINTGVALVELGKAVYSAKTLFDTGQVKAPAGITGNPIGNKIVNKLLANVEGIKIPDVNKIMKDTTSKIPDANKMFEECAGKMNFNTNIKMPKMPEIPDLEVSNLPSGVNIPEMPQIDVPKIKMPKINLSEYTDLSKYM